VNSNVAALAMSLEDPRWRFVLHANWRAQTLPMLINGLPSKSQISSSETTVDRFLNMKIPDSEAIASISPYDQIRRGCYKTPTYLIHGTRDDLIPWQQSYATIEALVERGVDARADIVEGAEHCFDVWSDKLDDRIENGLLWLSHQCQGA
jgi:pimeloyl-ACP methyl ester carboxylesterase